MTLKNSFLASIKENNKRRILVWILSGLAFLLFVPAFVTLSLNSNFSQMEYYAEVYGKAAAEQMLHTSQISNMRSLLGTNEIYCVIITLLAVFSAVQGFTYLNNKRKIDFYMGMPVKRKRRYLTIWLNGILVFIIPYMIGIIISALIGVFYGAVDLSVLGAAGIGFLLNTLFYLSVYHLSILAVMLTGNLMISLLGILVFFLYELCARYILINYMSDYFDYYPEYGLKFAPVLSPFSMYFNAVGAESAAAAVKSILILMIFGAVIGVIAYVCYLKRPAEAAGKAMVFSVTKPVVKGMITVLAALTAGGLISSTVVFRNVGRGTENGIGFVIFTIIVTVIVLSCVMQMIYEFDIKAMFHKKIHIVVNLILTAMILLIFKFDLLGYDSYIPKSEKVESAALAPNNLNTENLSYNYYDNKLNYQSGQEYIFRNMYLADTQSFCELVKRSMELDQEHRRNIADDKASGEQEDSFNIYKAIVAYRLKSGSVKYRAVYIDLEDEKTIALLDKIQGEPEFKEGFYIGESNLLTDFLKTEDKDTKVKVSYGNTIYNENMSREEAVTLLELYRKDLEKTAFSEIRNSVPIGGISFELGRKLEFNNWSSATTGFVIYPFFENCVQFLKEKGYYMEFGLRPEDVAQIEVVNYNREAYKMLQNKEKEGSGIDDSPELMLAKGRATAYQQSNYYNTEVAKSYMDEKEIEQIISCLYPRELLHSGWSSKNVQDENYVVNVYFKSGTAVTKTYGNNAQYGFILNEIPGFVISDTKYQ